MRRTLLCWSSRSRKGVPLSLENTSPDGNSRLRIYAALLSLVVIGLNLNTFQNDFNLEDPIVFRAVRPPVVAQIDAQFNIARETTSPITRASFQLDRYLWKDNPVGFHGANVILHVLCTLLVFAAGRRLLNSAGTGFWAALFFAVHPMHVEAVASIGGRHELLLAFAVLAGVWAITAMFGPQRHSWQQLAVLLLSAFLGIVCDLRALVLLPVWLLLACHFARNLPVLARLKGILRDYKFWSLIAVSAAAVAVRRALAPSPPVSLDVAVQFVDNPLLFASMPSRVLTSLYLWGRYLSLLIWPFRVSADYAYRTIPLIARATEQPFLLSASVWTVLLVSAVLARSRPLYLVSLLFFLITLAPVTNPFFPGSKIMADSFVYVPSVSFCWALAHLFQDRSWIQDFAQPGRKPTRQLARFLLLITACLVLPWMLKSYMRNAEWRDSGTLLHKTIARSPMSARARGLMGAVRLRELDLYGAERDFRRALEIYPDYAAAAIGLGSTYLAMGKNDQAVQRLVPFEDRSGSLEPSRANELAQAYWGLGYLPKAAEVYEAMLSRDPSDARIHRDLGILYLKYLNQAERGRSHLRRSLELAPEQSAADELRLLLLPGR